MSDENNNEPEQNDTPKDPANNLYTEELIARADHCIRLARTLMNDLSGTYFSTVRDAEARERLFIGEQARKASGLRPGEFGQFAYSIDPMCSSGVSRRQSGETQFKGEEMHRLHKYYPYLISPKNAVCDGIIAMIKSLRSFGEPELPPTEFTREHLEFHMNLSIEQYPLINLDREEARQALVQNLSRRILDEISVEKRHASCYEHGLLATDSIKVTAQADGLITTDYPSYIAVATLIRDHPSIAFRRSVEIGDERFV